MSRQASRDAYRKDCPWGEKALAPCSLEEYSQLRSIVLRSKKGRVGLLRVLRWRIEAACAVMRPVEQNTP